MSSGTWQPPSDSPPPPAPPPPAVAHRPTQVRPEFVNWNLKLSDCFKWPSLNEEDHSWLFTGVWSATTFWFAVAKVYGAIDWPWSAALWPLTFPLIGLCGLVAFIVVVAIVNSTVDWLKSCLRKD